MLKLYEMLHNKEQKMYCTLRIAMAMCFIGHGSFGIITKAIWCNYFAVAGIGAHLSYQLMPVVGAIDILLGIAMLVYPIRSMAWWLVIWGLFTALLRPLSGEPFAEFIERAGNYGAPLTMLILCGFDNRWQLLQRLKPVIPINNTTSKQLLICLQAVVFLLFVGHGWLNVIGKKGLLVQYASLGFTDTAQVALYVGIAEMTAAIIVLFRPVKQLLILLLIWKIVSELLYPQYELFEWVERGGSYGCVLALIFMAAPATDTKYKELTLG